MVESHFIWAFQDLPVHMRLTEVWKKDLLVKMNRVVPIPAKLKTRIRNTHWDLAQCPRDMSILKEPGPKCVKDITISRAKVGQRLWQYKNSDFTLDNYVKPEILNIYDPLHDRHLANWLHQPGILERLKEHNIIDSKLNVKCRLKEYLDYLRYLEYMYAMEFQKEVERRFQSNWQEREIDKLMARMKRFHEDLIRDSVKLERLELIKKGKDPSHIEFPRKHIEFDLKPGRINPEKYEYEDWEYQLWQENYSELQEILEQEKILCEEEGGDPAAEKKEDYYFQEFNKLTKSMDAHSKKQLHKDEKHKTEDAFTIKATEFQVEASEKQKEKTPIQKIPLITIPDMKLIADNEQSAGASAEPNPEKEPGGTNDVAENTDEKGLQTTEVLIANGGEGKAKHQKKKRKPSKSSKEKKSEDISQVKKIPIVKEAKPKPSKKNKKTEESLVPDKEKPVTVPPKLSKGIRKSFLPHNLHEDTMFRKELGNKYMMDLQKARKPCPQAVKDEWCRYPGWTAGGFCSCGKDNNRLKKFSLVVCKCPYPKSKFKC